MTNFLLFKPLYTCIQTRHGSGKEVVVAMQAKKDVHVGYQTVVLGGKAQRVPIQVTYHSVPFRNLLEQLVKSHVDLISWATGLQVAIQYSPSFH